MSLTGQQQQTLRAAAVAEGRLPTPNFEDGVRNQLVLEAVERAAASRSWQDVPQTV